jgi:hypothetical protein
MISIPLALVRRIDGLGTRLALNIFCQTPINNRVKPIRIMLTLALVALWPLAVSHCDLEQLPGFKFLACVEGDSGAPHQQNDCETDSCAVVETASYKPESGRLVVPTPPGTLSLFLTAILLESACPAVEISVSLKDDSSSLPTSWQFFLRTALPIRAPSLVS